MRALTWLARARAVSQVPSARLGHRLRRHSIDAHEGRSAHVRSRIGLCCALLMFALCLCFCIAYLAALF